jgi:hypothetical protein
MLSELLEWWQRHVLLGLLYLGVGVLVLAPLLLVPSWRKRLLRLDIDIEGVGLLALIALVVAIGCYNYFGSGAGT